MYERKSNFTPEFEKEVLSFNIKNYLKRVPYNHNGILSENIQDRKGNIYNENIKLIKSRLVNNQKDFIWKLEYEMKDSVISESIILENRYKRLFVFLSIDDLDKLKSQANNFIRDHDGMVKQEILECSSLKIIQEIQYINDIIQTSAKAAQMTENEAQSKKKEKTYSMPFQIELLRQLGVIDYLRQKYPKLASDNANISKILAVMTKSDFTNVQKEIMKKSTHTLKVKEFIKGIIKE